MSRFHFLFQNRCICTVVKYIRRQGFSIAIEERGGETRGLGECSIVQTRWLGAAASSLQARLSEYVCADVRFSATAVRAEQFEFSIRCHGLAEKHRDGPVASLRAECSEQGGESTEPQLTDKLNPHPPWQWAGSKVTHRTACPLLKCRLAQRQNKEVQYTKE